MSGRRLLPLILLVLLITPLLAQEHGDEEERVFLATGMATLEAGGRSQPIPFSLTPQGPLFGIEPLAAALGGELEPGLKGGGYTLRLGGAEYILGADSDALVLDQQILQLSQRPVAGPGGVQVPLDLLELTYGDALGYGFDWDGAGRRLYVDRRRARDLPLAVDVVDLGGTTTVVLRFREKPRYRIVEGPRRVDVEVLGDRVDPRVAIPRFDDGLIRDIEVTPHRIRLELAPDAEASSYSLSRPSFRLVFDVHRPAAGVAGTARTPYEPPDRRPGVRTIVIDPGHGGGESGAVGPDGALEKDLTLLLARSLRRRLLQRLPVEVVLTRDEDVSLPLETRTAVANENKGDLFISLHLNSSLGAMAAGAETYFLSLQASDERAAEAAATENQSAGAEAEADPLRDLQLILWDLAQSRHLADSQRLAKLIQEELNVTLGLRDRGVRQAPFRVLMGAAMPAVLVELGFLNNPVEEQKLVDPAYRDELVEAVVRAVVRYRAQSLGGEAEAGEELP